MLDAHSDAAEVRSGTEMCASQAGKPLCPLLKFQGKLTKESQVLLGHFYSSRKKPCVNICIWCLQAISFNKRRIRLSGSLPSTHSFVCFKTKQAACNPGEPAGSSPFLFTKEAGNTEMLPLGNLCNHSTTLSFQDGRLTHRCEMRG